MTHLNISGQMLELRVGDEVQLVPDGAVFVPLAGAVLNPDQVQPVMVDDPIEAVFDEDEP